MKSYKRKPNTVCGVCSKAIYRRPCEMEKNSGNAYCSMKCYGISCRRELPCAACGKLILAGWNKKTCSRTCANKQRAGISYTGPRKDKVVSQRSLKLRLLSARGTQCERCGYRKPEVLQVHHKDRNRGNNNLDNLALICPNCHYEEHYLQKSWLKRKLITEGSDSGSFHRT